MKGKDIKMEKEVGNNANLKSTRNVVEMTVISDGFSLQSINLMYSGCQKSQNNKPSTAPPA